MSVAQSGSKADITSHIHCFAGDPGGTLVTVDGELDAANADQLAAYAWQSASRSRRVTLDLRLEFIGTAGFSALRRINVACSGAHVSWAWRRARR